jgi:hypothetical protein
MQQSHSVYKDEKWLVVPVDGDKLPPRCLWTNLPTDGQIKEVTVVEQQAGWEARTVGIWPKVVRRSVRVPCKDFLPQDLPAIKRRTAMRILLVSAPALLISFGVLALLFQLGDGHWFVVSQIGFVVIMSLIFILLASLIGVIVGLAWPFLELPSETNKKSNLVHVGLVTDSHFWLPNAHADVLGPAQPWPGKSRFQHLEERPTFFQTAIQAWPSVLALVVVAILLGLLRGFLTGFFKGLTQ